MSRLPLGFAAATLVSGGGATWLFRLGGIGPIVAGSLLALLTLILLLATVGLVRDPVARAAASARLAASRGDLPAPVQAADDTQVLEPVGPVEDTPSEGYTVPVNRAERRAAARAAQRKGGQRSVS